MTVSNAVNFERRFATRPRIIVPIPGIDFDSTNPQPSHSPSSRDAEQCPLFPRARQSTWKVLRCAAVGVTASLKSLQARLKMPVARKRDLDGFSEEDTGSAQEPDGKLASTGRKRTRTGCLNCRRKRRKCRIDQSFVAVHYPNSA